jgi:hypothetical protein
MLYIFRDEGSNYLLNACTHLPDNMKDVSNLLQQYNHIILYVKAMKEMEWNATPMEQLLHGTG